MVEKTAPGAAPSRRPWYAPLVRLWRSENPRWTGVRDVLIAAFVVFLLLSAIWVYTGQPFPSQAPLVVVESGSMMHGPRGPCMQQPGGCAAFDGPPFGRVGTIDPGDLVLVKKVKGFDDVETAFDGGKRSGYGAHGDVLIYKKPDPLFPTPVIHRALLLITVQNEGCIPAGGESKCIYTIPETCDPDFASYVQPRSDTSDWKRYCTGSDEAITFDLERDGVFLSLTAYPCSIACNRPFYSGIITKGDNNQIADQGMPYPGDQDRSTAIACCPIREDWILGKARGEIPWFGLIKLAIYGNARYQCGPNQACSDPTGGPQWHFVKATAPADIWVSLFVALGVLIAAPVATDFVVGRIRRARRPPPKPVVAATPPLPPPPPPPAPAEPASPAQVERRAPARPRRAPARTRPRPAAPRRKRRPQG